MRFDEYMSLCLYHPEHGYYATGPRTGRAGHFLTSPELDPAFGMLWARGFEQVWESCDRPNEFAIVEIGPGEGGFAAAVLDSVSADLRTALTYTMVEWSPDARRRQEERLRSHPEVNWVERLGDLGPGGAGVVFANEVLDNLPVRLAEVRDGRAVELLVDVRDDELEFRPNGEIAHPTASIDGRLEIPTAAEAFVKEAADVVNRGALFFVDYGFGADELAARSAGTLLAYSEEGVDDRVLDRPGEKDITAHVNWPAVTIALSDLGCEIFGPRPQRDVLRALGATEVDGGLAAEHEDALARGDGASAIRALSRRQALGALLDPAGLGGLDVVAGIKLTAPPSFLRA